MTDEKIKISIVIPTYNRKMLIVGCLHSLIRQSYPKEKYELIVVDDGSTDDTYDAVKKMQENTEVTIRIYRQKNKGPSAARNLGIKKARGEIVCFIDDDCTADKDWLKNLTKIYKQNNVGGVGGKIIAKNSNLISRYGGTILQQKADSDGNIQTALITSNASYRRKVLETVGVFDENLHTNEDTDLGIRVTEKKYALKYAEDAVIYHNPRESIGTLFRQQYNYGKGKAVLYKKYPGKFSLLTETGVGLLKVMLGFFEYLKFFSAKDKAILIAKPFLDSLVLIARTAGKVKVTITGKY